MEITGRKLLAMLEVLTRNNDICELYEKHGVLREELREAFHLAEKGIRNVEESEWNAAHHEALWNRFVEETSKETFNEKELKEGKIVKNFFGSVETHKKSFDTAVASSLKHYLPPALYCATCDEALQRDLNRVHPCPKCFKKGPNDA